MDYAQKKAFMVECQEALKDNIIRRPLPAKSWQIGSPDGSSVYSYRVTWSPSTLTLSGDLDQLTLTHHTAMPNLVDTVRWLNNNPDFNYFLSKSDAKQKLDRDQTLVRILRDANENAKEHFKNWRDDLREYRQSLTDDPDPDGTEKPDCLGYHYYHGFWEKARHQPNMDFWDQVPGMTHPEYNWFPGCTNYRWKPPGGFELWAKIALIFDVRPDMVIHGAIRRKLKRQLADRLINCHDSEVADICHEIGYDDYSGNYDYLHQAYWQMAALFAWADLVSKEPEFITEAVKLDDKRELARQEALLNNQITWYS